MVKIIKRINELVKERESETLPIGFVPTMGNLHEGHLSLLEQALKEYKIVYFSIFVNPKQFGPNDDFNRYPRTLEADIALISERQKNFPESKIVVFAPQSADEVYTGKSNQTVSVYGLNNDLEGKLRPGHFDGVATVVYRLFEIMQPKTAYFGLKDYQQYIIVKKMVKDLALPITIKGMPIIREESGLALSSRNQYLSAEQKSASALIYRTLGDIKKILNGSHQNLKKAYDFVENILKDPNWNYIELRDSETFSKDLSHSKNISILAVYQMGSTRLLDNMQVELK